MCEEIKEKTKVFESVLDKIPQLCYAGDPCLRQTAKEVILEEGLLIARKLESILMKYRAITGWGRGLAAPQIGETKSVFITFVDNKIEVFINPKIEEKSAKTNFYRELCMSAGIVAADVERPEWIIMEWTDAQGKKRIEKFEGFAARLYQHEEAHLRGRLNLDDAAPGGIQFVNFDPLQEKLRDAR